MGSELASTPWGTITHHQDDGILELRWLPTAMTDAAFKATLTRFAWEAEIIRPSFLLVDATEFRHQFGRVMEWRDDFIIPRYGAAGVRKFAVHVPPDFPNTIETGGREVIDGPAVFPTAWFCQRERALEWLRRAD